MSHTRCISVPQARSNEEKQERQGDESACLAVAASDREVKRLGDTGGTEAARCRAHKQPNKRNLYFLKVTQRVILFRGKLTRCSLARSISASHASQRHQHLPASVQLSQTKMLVLFFLILLASPFLHPFALCLPVLPPSFFLGFFASVFHLFGLLPSPLPLNHILRLSFHTLAHALQHNG